MFAGSDSYYFATVRKISVAFGSLFNNIYIQRFEGKGGTGNVTRRVRVPLSYAAGEKWYVHRKSDIPAQEAVQTKNSLPRIGFELTGMQYDPNRQLNSCGSTVKTDPNDSTQILKQLNPVPYDLQYDVSIAVKSIDDALQIIEQIIPNFRPSFNMTVKDIPELQITKDVPVIFGGMSFTDQYEGSFEEPRVHIWTLSFVVKGYLYPAIGDADIIKKVYVDINKDKEMTQKQSMVVVDVDPIESAFEDEWTAKENVFDETQIDSNGEPIVDSNGDPII